MKKPRRYEKFSLVKDFDSYDADEMDAYVAHLEQARDEAREVFQRLNKKVECGRISNEQVETWLSRYASEKVEGGGE